MKLPLIFSNRQFRGVAIATAVIALVYLLIMSFAFGGDAFIFALSGSLNAPLALIITIFAASIYRLMGSLKHPKVLWGSLVAGWGLWALAETIWFVSSLLGQEVPYPSLADLFWVVGYIPMGYGLIARIRELATRPTRGQNFIIWGSSIAIVIATSIFVFLPIIQYFDPAILLESILNILYPLADLFLVILIVRLFFSFEKGDYGFGWRLLAVGFILMTVSDFIFTYAVWQEIYYPEMEANLVSRLFVDAPYTLSYFLWFLGIYALRLLLQVPQKVEAIVPPKRVPHYGHILISTREDDTIIAVSPNVNRLLETESLLGKSLSEALTITERDAKAVLAMLQAESRVADLPIQVRNRLGYSQEIKLCGMVVRDSDKKYAGSNLLLRVQTDDLMFDAPLSQESRSMIAYLLEKSGSSYSIEIGNFLLEYHLAYLKGLFTLVQHEGGESLTRSLVKELKEFSAKNNWLLQYDPSTGIARTIYPLEVLRQALPSLLQVAKQFAARVVDPETVETRMQETSSQFNEVIHMEAARFLKSGTTL